MISVDVASHNAKLCDKFFFFGSWEERTHTALAKTVPYLSCCYFLALDILNDLLFRCTELFILMPGSAVVHFRYSSLKVVVGFNT